MKKSIVELNQNELDYVFGGTFKDIVSDVWESAWKISVVIGMQVLGLMCALGIIRLLSKSSKEMKAEALTRIFHKLL